MPRCQPDDSLALVSLITFATLIASILVVEDLILYFLPLNSRNFRVILETELFV